MQGPGVGRQRRGAVLLAGFLGLCFWKKTAFVGAPSKSMELMHRDAVRDSSQVAMRSQAQGGRYNLWQTFMPKVKGGKKMALFRPKKNYGSFPARQLPRRYPLYDILEHLDKKVPVYTIISEPEEPLRPVYDVPLKDRYPWAGKLNKVHWKKYKEEKSWKTGLEPLFGNIYTENLPPQGRRQTYVDRKGWHNFAKWKHPIWLNRAYPGMYIPKEKMNAIPFRKDRRPRWDMLSDEQKASGKFPKIIDDPDNKWRVIKGDDVDAATAAQLDEFDDGLDAALGAMEE